jgi:hypothetical protein
MSTPPADLKNRTGWLKRVASFWLAHEPVRLARWEIVLLRVVIALLVWDTHTTWLGVWNDPAAAVRQMTVHSLDGGSTFTGQPHPNGVAMFLDLTFLSDDRIEKPLEVATGVSLLLYAFGVPAIFSLAIPCLYTLALYTLFNSQGSIGHTAQAIHLVLLCVWLAGIRSFYVRKRQKPLPCEFNAGQFEMDWARQGLMSVYVVSAITKLWMTQGLWFVSAKYFPLHLVKNNEMEYYDTLNESARHLDWLPQFLMDRPLVSQIMFGLALPLELFAFLALLNRRIAAVFGIGLIAFHESVTQLTHLSFIFNKLLLLFLFVSPLWWLWRIAFKAVNGPGLPASVSGR